jgi:hypothetical protein
MAACQQQQQGREYEQQGALWMVMSHKQAQLARRGEQHLESGAMRTRMDKGTLTREGIAFTKAVSLSALKFSTFCG